MCVAAGAATESYDYMGPAGGYKVELRDGVTVHLRFCRDTGGVLHTEYRISCRWKLPSPIEKLLAGVRRVFDFFKGRKHHVIPFSDQAKDHLLGCQLEQNLLGDDCNKVGDMVGETQHGQAAGHIGIYSALLCVLRWAATPSAQAAANIQIEMKDVELAGESPL